jgi:hypothetical protein
LIFLRSFSTRIEKIPKNVLSSDPAQGRFLKDASNFVQSYRSAPITLDSTIHPKINVQFIFFIGLEWTGHHLLDIKNPIFQTHQVQIPNLDDTSYQVEWRTCDDRWPDLHSNPTSHPKSSFYAPNPVEINTSSAVTEVEVVYPPKPLIDHANMDDHIETQP